METIAGVDVNLECLGTSITDQNVTITWGKSDGTILFECSRLTTSCDTSTTIHTLGRNDTFISSTLAIRNVSLVHESEYVIIMVSPSNREICKINLTVNVPPKGLIVVEVADDSILQNQASFTVAEGENKTLVCKTNASVKPAVNLKWMYPKELYASVDSQQYVNDERDERLFVPTRMIHFTPTYADDEYIVLICTVASNFSFDQIQTSVLIKNEGELTTDSKTLGTSSIGSNVDLQEPKEAGWYIQIPLVIAGCSSLVMLFIVLAFVGGIIRCRKRAVEGSSDPAIQTSANLSDDETSHTRKPTPTSGIKYLDLNFDRSDLRNAFSDVSEVPHTYMTMKHINTWESPASNNQQVSHFTTSVDDHGDVVLYVSPTPIRKQVKACSNLKEEPTYVNTEGASTYCEIRTDIPNIVKEYTDGLDDVVTTYL